MVVSPPSTADPALVNLAEGVHIKLQNVAAGATIFAAVVAVVAVVFSAWEVHVSEHVIANGTTTVMVPSYTLKQGNIIVGGSLSQNAMARVQAGSALLVDVCAISSRRCWPQQEAYAAMYQWSASVNVGSPKFPLPSQFVIRVDLMSKHRAGWILSLIPYAKLSRGPCKMVKGNPSEECYVVENADARKVFSLMPPKVLAITDVISS